MKWIFYGKVERLIGFNQFTAIDMDIFQDWFSNGPDNFLNGFTAHVQKLSTSCIIDCVFCFACFSCSFAFEEDDNFSKSI